MAHGHTLGQSVFRSPPPTPSQEVPRRRVRTGFGQAQALTPPPPEATPQALDPQERAGEIVQELLRDSDEMFRQMRGQINTAQREGMDVQRIFGPQSGIRQLIDRNVETLRDALIAANMDPSKADRVQDLFLGLIPPPQTQITTTKPGEDIQLITAGPGGGRTAQRIGGTAPLIGTLAAGAVPFSQTTGQLGQRNPPIAKRPKIRAVIDNQTKRPTFVSEAQILANPDRYGPIPTGLKLRVTDDGVEFVTGGQELTSASTTGAQKQKRQTTELLANVSTLKRLFEKSIKAGKPIIGALPAFRGFLNKTLVQFVPGLFDKDRAKFERAVKVVRQTALRVVSDETRFSEQDRDFIFDLFPSTGIFGSEEEAAVKMNVLTAFFARRFSGALTDLGLDEASIPQITPEDIRVAVESGFLDEEEGGKILRQLFPERFTRD